MNPSKLSGFNLVSKSKQYLTLVWERQEIKLSDAERVILENVDKEILKIGKTKFGTLYVVEVDIINKHTVKLDIYNQLFKFIKNGEEYLIKDLLDEEVQK